MGLTSFAHQMRQLVRELGSPAARVTIGEVVLSPGYIGVIPEEAHFTLDLRDISQSHLNAANHALREAAERVAASCQLTLELEELGHLSPTQCAPEIADQIELLAERRGFSTLRTPSGATHDAVPMSSLTPVGMIFVPSVQGVSHSPSEYTSPEALARGATLLLDTLYYYATQSSV